MPAMSDRGGLKLQKFAERFAVSPSQDIAE